MIITRTPFRISFFGGGTDHPLWYREHGGAVISTTIDKYCYVSCRYLPPFFKYKYRIVYSKNEMVKSIDKIKHPVVRECLRFMNIKKGLEIHHDGDLPARAGLGTSSSFTVGLLHALYALTGRIVGKKKLSYEAIEIEQSHMKEAVGSQDQVAASFGGFNKIEFLRDGEININPIILPKERLKSLKNHLMLYFTGFTRYAPAIEREKLNIFSKKIKELEIISQMVDESLTILNGGKLENFGRLLNDSWRLKKSLSSKVSSPHIDRIYEKALKAGALGGKILGAGGGGFILLFVKPEHQSSIRKKLGKLLEIPFNLEGSGSQVVFYKPEYLYDS